MSVTGPVSRGIAHHPYPIRKLDELPESLMRLAHEYAHLYDCFDFMMIVPSQSFIKGLFTRRMVPQQALLFYPEGVLHLQDNRSAGVPGTATWIEARSATRLGNSLLLLHGKLEFTAESGATIQTIEVEYNTVAYDLLKPSIQRFLQQACSSLGRNVTATADCKSPDTSGLPYKFQSGLRIYALLPDEKVCGFVFQPEIREPRLGFMRRKITPNTLIALTDRQVVFIQEELSTPTNYGWVITHVPRQRIAKVRCDPAGERQIISIRNGVNRAIKTLIVTTEIAKQWMQLAETLLLPD
ncbi:MAG TPA: hypothetical protein VLH85_02625 [Levilinea sp.]|nr:hypothetical protein [Levilinea sp.]